MSSSSTLACPLEDYCAVVKKHILLRALYEME